MNILIVEDDPEMRDFLVQGLTQAGHKVITAADGASGLDLALRESFDVMVLDRMLPGLNGIEVLTSLRNRNIQRPVLMLSALGDVDHRVTGLKHGADDYLAKPFSLVELCARLDALHRRDVQPNEATTLQVADLKLDLLAHSAQRGEQVIELWPLEFRLLEYLVRNAGRVVTRNMLLENVWNLHFDPQTNVVEVHMSRLRGKIDKGFEARLIHTVRGSGYVLRAP
ncbi:MAG: response regulator transcription factor [Spongiibacteraceae bacterium]